MGKDKKLAQQLLLSKLPEHDSTLVGRHCWLNRVCHLDQEVQPSPHEQAAKASSYAHVHRCMYMYLESTRQVKFWVRWSQQYSFHGLWLHGRGWCCWDGSVLYVHVHAYTSITSLWCNIRKVKQRSTQHFVFMAESTRIVGEIRWKGSGHSTLCIKHKYMYFLSCVHADRWGFYDGKRVLFFVKRRKNEVPTSGWYWEQRICLSGAGEVCQLTEKKLHNIYIWSALYGILL